MCSEMIECRWPECKNQFKASGNKAYCCRECNHQDSARIIRAKRAANKAAGIPRECPENTNALEAANIRFQRQFKEQGWRRCLQCDQKFLSDGPWHRICPTCKPRYNQTSKARHVDRYSVVMDR